MSKCSLFLVDEDLFFKFSSSSYSLVTGIKTKLLKRGAKDATRMARSTQEHGNWYPAHYSELYYFLLVLTFILVFNNMNVMLSL